MNRREFVTATSAGASMAVMPTLAKAKPKSPANKLNIALIGVWGRGLAHYDSIEKENVVALCDVNEAFFADALKRFPERGPQPAELLALGIREYRETFFKPYRVVYRVEDKQVIVYLIADGRRDMQSLLARRLLAG